MALNCRNCGGPLTVVPNRDYFMCEFCGAFAFREVQGKPERDRERARAGQGHAYQATE